MQLDNSSVYKFMAFQSWPSLWDNIKSIGMKTWQWMYNIRHWPVTTLLVYGKKELKKCIHTRNGVTTIYYKCVYYYEQDSVNFSKNMHTSHLNLVCIILGLYEWQSDSKAGVRFAVTTTQNSWSNNCISVIDKYSVCIVWWTISPLCGGLEAVCSGSDIITTSSHQSH